MWSGKEAESAAELRTSTSIRLRHH